MNDEETAWHRQVAVEQFNRTWDLIDQTDRTDDDDTEMLLAAATSRWHWGQIGDAEQRATGDWQVAHVASLLGHGSLALTFAEHHLAVANDEGWSGWRLASAQEGMARALAVVGDDQGRDRHLKAANRALDSEDDDESAQVIRDQLATIAT